jgi:U4/U6.U5 tri-snRNP component SNU23
VTCSSTHGSSLTHLALTRCPLRARCRRMEAGREAGFYCEVCDCTLKDSLAWLDHLNGVYHNRALGLDVTEVERSTVDQVKKRLERAKRRKRGEIAAADEDGGDAPLLLLDGKAASDDEEESDEDESDEDESDDSDDSAASDAAEDAEDAEDEEDEAAAMQKMMGFGSFGAD